MTRNTCSEQVCDNIALSREGSVQNDDVVKVLYMYKQDDDVKISGIPRTEQTHI